MDVDENQTLINWLRTQSTLRPDAPALATGKEITTYAALFGKVSKICSGLANIGINKGDVVAVQLPNSLEFVVAFLAISARGAIMQALHMPYRKKELHGLLEDSGAKAVIVTNTEKDSRARDVLSISDDLVELHNIIVVGVQLAGTMSYTDLASATAQHQDINAVDTDDPYLLLYTSGTTSKPKGVPHTYRRFLNNALSSASEMKMDSNSHILSLAALSHLYGLFTLHMSLAAGATSHLLPMFNPANFLDDLQVSKPTHIYAAPAHFVPLMSKGHSLANLLEPTKLICLSGAAVPPQLARDIDEMMKYGSVIQLWGMSELQAGTFGRVDDPAKTRFETAGSVVANTNIRIVDEYDVVLPPNTEGSLQVIGPSVFEGYLNRPEESQLAFTSDGWFKTGDLAKVDDQGFMSITGRVKELINRGGVKFNPAEVEEVLHRHPAIEICAIIPVTDNQLGERSCLCAKLNEGCVLTLEDVKTALSEIGMAKYKWPESLVILDGVPMTPTRKVMRGELIKSIGKSKE